MNTFKEIKTGFIFDFESKEEVKGINLIFLKRDGRTYVRTEDEFLINFTTILNTSLNQRLDSLIKKASEFNIDDLVIDANVTKEIINYFETKNSVEEKTLIEKIEKVLK